MRADMPTPSTTTFITISEWNGILNNEYAGLYGLLVQKFGADYYVKDPPYSLTTDATNTHYALPSDFFKLLGVDLQVGTEWVTVDPFNFAERNRYSSVPVSGQVIRVHYVPLFTALGADSDVANFLNGWDDYVVVGAALQAALKEESLETAALLQRERAEIEQRIEAEAENRDASGMGSTTDIRGRDTAWSPAPYQSPPVYRLNGSKLWLAWQPRGGIGTEWW